MLRQQIGKQELAELIAAYQMGLLIDPRHLFGLLASVMVAVNSGKDAKVPTVESWFYGINR